MNSADLLAFRVGAHNAACVLFLLLACLLWRDRRASVVGRLSAALAAGAAADAINSAPGFQPITAGWQAPIVALSCGAPMVFWLWARAAFDDEFEPRPWHAAPWAALAGGGLLVSYARTTWPEAGLAVGTALPLLALALALLAATQTVATWREDLVAGRRRLRSVVLVSTVVFIAVDAVSSLTADRISGGTMASALPEPLRGSAIGLCALAFMASWSLFRIPRIESRTALMPTEPDPIGATISGPAGARNGLDAADQALLRRLDHLMKVERVYRQEGLTIGTLATKLKVPVHRLRRAINEGLGYRNFNAFLNRYRIEESEAALADPAQKDVPVLTIAMDAGFQSIGPFNRAFKADTGMTPTDYRRAALAKPPASTSFKSREKLEIGKPD